MKIIQSIEINYFRSIYQDRIRDLSDLNVITGGNDSGKSNILRALNLFFNNELSDYEDFDFLQDVTHYRQAEARDAKGRLTIWMRITFNNIEGWRTLPDRFFVKKVWNRYSNQPEISTDVDSQQSLTRFLNKINFIYIPAVKDRSIYSKYLRQVYDSISSVKEVDLTQPASVLSRSVNAAIESMSDKIAENTGVVSHINVPSDFRDLFERLNFVTTEDDFNVPLSSRGDGVQARHIPHILEYICENNRKNNIWGFEEPENSLEMGRSFEVANQFLEEFSKPNQIFCTSHSPAFYSLKGERVAKFFVEKTSDDEKSSTTKIRSLEDASIADAKMGIAQIISDRAKELYDQISALDKQLSEIKAHAIPVLITEGDTDVVIFNAALEKTDQPGDFLHVIPCDPVAKLGGGAPALARTLDHTPHDDRQIRIGIFDRDKSGIKEYNNLKHFDPHPEIADVKCHPNAKAFAIILPELDWDDPYFELAGKPVAIEQMFDRELFNDASIEYTFDASGGSISREKADNLIETLGFDDAKKILNAKINFRNKNRTAARIAEFEAEEFYNFVLLFETIEILLAE